MQSENDINRPRGQCAICGKEVILPSVRERRPQYCSRVCASMGRYKSRYSGTDAGPADKPDLTRKMTEL